jgi:hypothetical protein
MKNLDAVAASSAKKYALKASGFDRVIRPACGIRKTQALLLHRNPRQPVRVVDAAKKARLQTYSP